MLASKKRSQNCHLTIVGVKDDGLWFEVDLMLLLWCWKLIGEIEDVFDGSKFQKIKLN